jgi:hypothetical protein
MIPIRARLRGASVIRLDVLYLGIEALLGIDVLWECARDA